MRAPRALVFRAPAFPSIDAPAIDDATLDAAFEGLDVVRARSLDELEAQLHASEVDALVLTHGSAFPVDAWPRIRAFLRRGKNLVVLGGAPFHEPVRFDHGAWTRGPRQAAFAHDLLIGPAEPLTIDGAMKTIGTPVAPAADGFTSATTTWALTLRLTSEKSYPDEHGSAGPRDAVARSLASVVDATGTPRGSLLLEVDRLRGPEAGARWLFATSDAKLDAKAIRSIVVRALQGGSEVRAVPQRALVEAGEPVEIFVSSTSEDVAREPFIVEVFDDSGKRQDALRAQGQLENLRGWLGATFPIDTKNLAPGLYHVEVRSASPEGQRLRDPARSARTGFVIRDEHLLGSGPKLTASADWLKRDGKTFPVVGTTYMASDVHRDFLFDPNPDAWDSDFAEMKRRGIRFVRTGIWTGWSRVMPAPNGVDEEALSSLEAFVQTAAKHDIVVCFTFFAFLPPAYGGKNHWLDPRSIYAQKSFVAAFAKRMRGVSWVHWDLINEPSYAPLAKLWSTRPYHEPYEAAAFRTWAEAKHPHASEGTLRSLWHAPDTSELFAAPRDEDFVASAVSADKRPHKARDFREFTEDTVAGWARSMRETIRSVGGPDTLVTLGQDEGGIHERAMQQLMAPSLDYTAVHTWWKNDDLLWDGVTTKVEGKPNLHQETGLMRLEDLGGMPWRTPAEAANLLERKLAYAFAARGAGVVEWVWNVNPYMPLDEESTIGLIRPDGTVKPELDVLARFAEFFRQAAPHLDDFDPDPVVIVLPHARAMLGLTAAIDATKPVIRVLSERFGVVPTAMSDLRLDAERLKNKKLILVPSPEVLDEAAARALVDASSHGVKVLITGAVTGDSYGVVPPSLARLGVVTTSRPVAMVERSAWSPSGGVAFEALAQERARRADGPSLSPGHLPKDLWHEPLPLELARDREPLVRLLRAALTEARVNTSPDDGVGGVAGRALTTSKVALLIAVNERAESATRRLMVDGRAFDLAVPPRRARVLLVDRKTGRTIVSW